MLNSIRFDKIVWIMLMATIICLAWGTSQGNCAEKKAGNQSLNQVQSPPSFEPSRIDYARLYKDRYSEWGPVTYVSKDWIVIGDHTVYLASWMSTSGISVGSWMGVTRDEDGNVTKIEEIEKPAIPKKSAK